jgi:hypothetical protein
MSTFVLAFPVQGDPVAVAGEHVPVEAVVRHVEFTVVEPLRERRVGPVEGAGERLVPVQQFAGLLGPETQPIFGGPFVQRLGGHGVGGELGRGRESAGFVEKMVDLHAHVVSLLCDYRRCRGAAAASSLNPTRPKWPVLGCFAAEDGLIFWCRYIRETASHRQFFPCPHLGGPGGLAHLIFPSMLINV